MRVVVTGAAGFIGSRLALACADRGWDTVGIDCLRPYYDLAIKRRNLEILSGRSNFLYFPSDLAADPLEAALSGVDVIFHLAGQPGVRSSWGGGFADYCADNVLATHRLLEAAAVASVPRIVYASSSSVYGDAQTYPVVETALPRPISPYGVTKLAAEHLCLAHSLRSHSVVVALRYFTVYGPGQRPDMAIQRLIRAALTGNAFSMFGSGTQVRDFTFVDDVVAATLLAATAPVGGPVVLNIAGGSSISLAELVPLVEQEVGAKIRLDGRPPQDGDVARTGGDSSVARGILGWTPRVALDVGIARQVEWVADHRGPALPA